MSMHDKIVECVEAGGLTWEQVAIAALTYLTDAQLAHLSVNEEWFVYDDESRGTEEEEKWYKTS
jgi:hypothetical protein